MMLAQFPDYARSHLGGHETMVTLLLAVFAIGVGLMAVPYFVRRRAPVAVLVIVIYTVASLLLTIDWMTGEAGAPHRWLSRSSGRSPAAGPPPPALVKDRSR